MENRDTVSKRKNDKSLWEEIVYLAKLMRSILLYHYRYDEATDNANWCNIIITAGIGTVFGTLATQIILMIFRFHDLGGTVVLPPNGLALFGIAHMPPFDPGVIIVDSLFSLITGFAVLLSLAYITAICLQLWFGEERDKHQLFGFMQVVVIVKSLYLIPLHLIDAVYPDYQEVLLFAEPITLFDTPTKLFTVYVSERFPDFLLFKFGHLKPFQIILSNLPFS